MATTKKALPKKQTLTHKHKALAVAGVFAFFGFMVFLLLQGHSFPVLDPKGTVAAQQKHLIINVTLLMLVVVIPVFVLTFFIAWKYRAGNKKARYMPEWDNNRAAEVTWWLIPLAIIIAISIMIWKSSHALDPRRPLESNKKPVKIQVVALQWKWLFIYPEQNIATVNFVQFPEDTPVNFEITSDAPMNSFWIPQLGGQIYAMAGMTTRLHLDASEQGDYKGSSANISGEGFAGMKFTARASSESDFNKWAASAKNSSGPLGFDEYQKLAQPSKNSPVATYLESDQNLYDKIIMKYMRPNKQEKLPAEQHNNMGGHHY